jgi:hypothetical protein
MAVPVSRCPVRGWRARRLRAGRWSARRRSGRRCRPAVGCRHDHLKPSRRSRREHTTAPSRVHRTAYPGTRDRLSRRAAAVIATADGPSDRKASGYTHRLFRPDAVRYMYVDTGTYRPAVIHPDTWRDEKETARRAAFPQRAGRFGWWWQVQGSNLGRRSRRFYRPFLPASPYGL